MTKNLLTLLILVWPFGQLLTTVMPGLNQNMYYLDSYTFLLTILLVSHKSSRQYIFQDYLFKPLLTFLTVASLSLAVNSYGQTGSQMLISLSYLLRLITYPAIYFSFKIYDSKSKRQLLWISLMIFSVICALQYFFLPDMRFLKNIGFDDHYYRLIGSFYDPNFTGAVLAALSLFMLASGRLPQAILFFLLLVPTFSRASYLSFSFGIIYLIFQKKKYLYLLVIGLLAALVVLIPKPFGEGGNLLRTFSIYSRIESVQNGIALFAQKPVLGWGYNTLRSADGSRMQIDNSFVFLLATTGVFGLAAFFGLLYSGLKQTSLPYRVLTITLLFHCLFNNSLFYIWIWSLFWMALALGSKEYKTA